jgi:U3 small nucleolar RNA-associated protein 24
MRLFYRRKFAQVKRIIGQRDSRLKKTTKQPKHDKDVLAIPQVPSSLFFAANTALSPPYSILVDTNFISRSVQLKLDLLPTFMDLLYAKCNLILTDCVIGELEKLGQRYSIALRIAKDERWERVKCDPKACTPTIVLLTELQSIGSILSQQMIEISRGESGRSLAFQ